MIIKASDILLKAARTIERGRYIGCCAAISRAFNTLSRGSMKHTPARDLARAYLKQFHPVGYGQIYWWGDTGHRPNQDARVIALTMAAAIAKSEGN